MKSKLAENIRAFRKERKMTQEQLAEAMGVTVGAVYKWESKQSTPDLNLIMDMADLFDTSTDVLIGYEWRNGSMGAALDRIKTLRYEKRFFEATSEAERALKKYPNCFDIVYQAASIYFTIGEAESDTKAYRRAVELFDHACELLPQNTDENISELSIRNQMARTHLRLGNADMCVELLKKHNVCGINNAMIGMVLADCHHRTDEAMMYLAKAFAEHIDNLDSLMMGYINVFVQKGDYPTAISCIQWLRNTLRNSQQAEEITWFDKYDCVLLALCAEVYCMMDDIASVRDCLIKAATQALRFDLTDISDIHGSSLFDKLGIEKLDNYYNYGKTAMEATERRVMIDAEVVPKLPIIWAAIKKEVIPDETV